jgi:hypothetical protein
MTAMLILAAAIIGLLALTATTWILWPAPGAHKAPGLLHHHQHQQETKVIPAEGGITDIIARPLEPLPPLPEPPVPLPAPLPEAGYSVTHALWGPRPYVSRRVIPPSCKHPGCGSYGHDTVDHARMLSDRAGLLPLIINEPDTAIDLPLPVVRVPADDPPETIPPRLEPAGQIQVIGDQPPSPGAGHDSGRVLTRTSPWTLARQLAIVSNVLTGLLSRPPQPPPARHARPDLAPWVREALAGHDSVDGCVESMVRRAGKAGDQ